MWVLLIYVVLMVIGTLLDYLLGAVISNYWSDAISLPFFLAGYFFTLWLSWILAVRIAERARLYS